MRILLTNDDGIDAPGLHVLEQAARQVGDVIVVAPAEAHSGCSHRVTTNALIRVHAAGANRFAVEGTPADCVRVALFRFGPAPMWVLSGVNEGGNLGADVHHSGTVAAVREAVLHGWAGAAFSQYKRKGIALDWNLAATCLPALLRDLAARPVEGGAYWNVNLPHLEPGAATPEYVYCPLDPHPLPLSFRMEDGHLHYNGDYHGRRRLAGADVDVCFGGRIAVTRLRLYGDDANTQRKQVL
ncbi:MAG TPA: 5'/3'-nucleotidase SurE [Gemmataceae bacterium]|nr:5'/3'-nucleotidase SurE [Gemmataceae bacterium]